MGSVDCPLGEYCHPRDTRANAQDSFVRVIGNAMPNALTESRQAAIGRESTSLRDKHPMRTASGPRLVLRAVPLRLAQICVFSAIVYSSWHFGATKASVWFNVSFLAIAALAFSFIAWVIDRKQLNAASLPMLATVTLFLGYAFLQTLPLPLSLLQVRAQSAKVHEEFGRKPAEMVLAQADALSEPEVDKPTWQTNALSIIPQSTKAALVPWSLAFVFGLIGSIVFRSSESRRALLWCVLLNSLALSLWGIVQRSTGSTDLLPGIPNHARSIPFASFVYRNAGAAAILPGLAAAAALLFIQRSKPVHSGQKNPTPGVFVNKAYSVSRQWSAADLALISLACLIFAGVIASLSRGAWMATLLAAFVGLLACRKQFSIVKSLGALGLCSVIVAFGSVQYSHQLKLRLQRVNVQELTVNERFEHWRLSMTTAAAYFPFGSGLGTYGYAALSEQTTPSKGWFREAHNQYLETIVELGAVGIATLALALFLIVRALTRLIRSTGHSEDLALGLFGLMVFVSAAAHNFFDFVITIPSNLILYGVIFGVIVSAGHSVQHLPRLQSTRPAFGTLLTFVFCGLIAAYGMAYARWESLGDLALKRTALAELDNVPSQDMIANRIRALDLAIDAQPDRAVLYRHRSLYHLAKYRLAVMEAVKEAGETLSWEHTRPEALYTILAALPADSRDLTASSLRLTAQLKEPLSKALVDIATALRCNPLYVQVHLAGAMLSPICDWPSEQWIINAAELSRSDPEKLHLAGLLAFHAEQHDQMISAWNQCLQVTSKYDQAIAKASLERLPLAKLTAELVPPSRPEFLVALIQSVLMPSVRGAAVTTEDAKKEVALVADKLLTDDRIETHRRQFVAATIFQLVGEQEKATDCWLEAIAADPKNPNYRYNAALHFKLSGAFDQALRQCTLGATLAPEDRRFGILKDQIRTQITKSNP